MISPSPHHSSDLSVPKKGRALGWEPLQLSLLSGTNLLHPIPDGPSWWLLAVNEGKWLKIMHLILHLKKDISRSHFAGDGSPESKPVCRKQPRRRVAWSLALQHAELPALGQAVKTARGCAAVKVPASSNLGSPECINPLIALFKWLFSTLNKILK